MLTALIALDEACALLRLEPAVAVTTLAVEHAAGGVLAQDLHAGRALPVLPLASRDGYAVASTALRGASPYTPVPLALVPQRVSQGEPMPEGTDAVLPLEALTVQGRFVEACEETPPFDGVDRPGAWQRDGQRLLAAGTPLSPAHVSLLAACAERTVAVRRPRLAVVLATGGPEPMADVVVPMVRMLVARTGGIVMPVLQADDEDSLRSALSACDCDAVLVVGGTGAGEHDATARLIAEAGELAFHGVALFPGMSAAFGHCQQRPVLAVPDRGCEAYAGVLALLTPLLAALCAGDCSAQSRSIRLTGKLASRPGLAELRFLVRDGDGVAPQPIDVSPAGLLASIGWVLVPAGSEGYAEGATIAMMDLP